MEIKQQLLVPKKHKWKKRTAALSRWLHTYLSMVSFFIILLFAITGITLNHATWFEGEPVETKSTGTMPVEWVRTKDSSQVKKLEIVEFLRKNYAIRTPVSDFVIEDDQCSMSFKGPGYSADAFVQRADGTFELTELKLGLIAIINDLHKGRDTGGAWSWLIDISSGFLALVSASGLAMLLFLKKKRFAGLLLASMGGLICYLVYYFLSR